MLSSAVFGGSSIISLALTPPLTFSLHFKNRAFLTRFSIQARHSSKSQVHYDSLRVLEWDKLCDSVSAFARTPLGREATKAQLWSLNQTYEESLRLLDETNAAVEMLKHGACNLDFCGVRVVLVQSAIQRAWRSSPLEGMEAVAVMELLQYAEHLQSNLKGAMKEDAEWYRRFMPLSEVIMEFVVNRSLAKLIHQVIDEDGRVKDSASPNLKHLRNQVRTLEKKIYQLMDSLIRNDKSEAPLMEVSTIDGRWCIKSSANEMKSFKGLLLPSGSGKGSIVEPLSAVPLNDELQQTRALVLESETEVHPVPVDFLISQKTRVLVITGPNTGGKTIGLKTVGLAAMMAKSGLHVLCSESVQIPWFDSVFADIGDEQSLSQSLSTFSGHLKHISDIQSESTSCSLVLLDEVGAGTNPLEGAALGMSLLESFAETGALLTIATTHHGELKTLKYSNDAFENACMEFDEVNLKPTYRILWGVPGRSNAINIAERLGLPGRVVDNARELYGAASAGIDEIIADMERLKQEYQEILNEAENHLMISRELHEKMLVAKRKIMEHANDQRFRQMREISEAAAMTLSILHKNARKQRESAIRSLQPTLERKRQHALATKTTDNGENSITKRWASSSEDLKTSASDKYELPKVGNMVFVSSLGMKATVLRVDPSKEEILDHCIHKHTLVVGEANLTTNCSRQKAKTQGVRKICT
ncbi:hypothetical protein ACLB2K_075365 [Fragaria x ananassa]